MEIANRKSKNEIYASAMSLALPMLAQSGVEAMANLASNLIIGRLGEAALSGVIAANQVVYSLVVLAFGAMATGGIFLAQFSGAGNRAAVKSCLKFKLSVGIIFSLVAGILFEITGRRIMVSYLGYSGAAQLGWEYLSITAIGLPGMTLCQAYAGTLRECGEAHLPMRAGILGAMTRFCLCLLLTSEFVPEAFSGIRGIAISSVVSHYIELAVLRKKGGNMLELDDDRMIPGLSSKIIVRGTPVVINEFLMSSGMLLLTRCYASKGTGMLAALSMAGAISSQFSVAHNSLANAAILIMGRTLGTGDGKLAKMQARQLIALDMLVCSGTSLIMTILAYPLTGLYNVDSFTRYQAIGMILICACFMPVAAIVQINIGMLRAGGKTLFASALDTLFMWGMYLPVIIALSRSTEIDGVGIYLVSQLMGLIKCAVGCIIVKRGHWINNLTRDYKKIYRHQ